MQSPNSLEHLFPWGTSSVYNAVNSESAGPYKISSKISQVLHESSVLPILRKVYAESDKTYRNCGMVTTKAFHTAKLKRLATKRIKRK